MNIFRLLMAPANAFCDLLHIQDEDERSVVRMLVNGLIWITIVAVVWYGCWIALGF